ncbi:DUF2716 domain-containing protein [Paralysiella testudinis]|uniref:DUF2716 domain-containing protein n=1 Tax=Paralysiella testudinis TaxID=2809020 RepID=A0A892ZD91_9NEIS|nr:DUF2716 domain-containing protein [Paralysiella testudinis]QRQ80633.1 DUF2716 domain-containing protein [Paralysiella testudinis]
MAIHNQLKFFRQHLIKGESMRLLAEPEYSVIWDEFYRKYNFNPSIENFPSISEPRQSITFGLALTHNDAMIHELTKCITGGLKCSTFGNEEFYYLDWQHQCYAGDVLELRRGYYPDGDYAIAMNKNLDFGTFGHPWERSICIIGEELVLHVIQNKPRIFNCILRNNFA